MFCREPLDHPGLMMAYNHRSVNRKDNKVIMYCVRWKYIKLHYHQLHTPFCHIATISLTLSHTLSVSTSTQHLLIVYRTSNPFLIWGFFVADFFLLDDVNGLENCSFITFEENYWLVHLKIGENEEKNR